MTMYKKLCYAKLARFCVHLFIGRAVAGVVIVTGALASNKLTTGDIGSIFTNPLNLLAVVVDAGLLIFALQTFGDETYTPYRWNIVGRFLKRITKKS